MRNLRLLDHLRLKSPEVFALYGTYGDDASGVFLVRSPVDGHVLKVVASSDYGWEHVSVSRANRCPNWPEMEVVKQLFFRDTETAMQLHVPKKDHVNYHSYCLHIWRPTTQEIPRPPGWMVGPMAATVEQDEPEGEANA